MGDNTPLNESTTQNSPVRVVVGSFQTSIVDISNPFFLHASDSPAKEDGTPVKSNFAYSIDESRSNSGDKPMTQDQYHHLYQLLQHVKLGVEPQTNTEESATVNCVGITTSPSPRSYFSVSLRSVSWILDSGASMHVTSDFNLLFNVKNLPKPIYVNLPNSTRALISKSGPFNEEATGSW
ncbi:hypothetical protein H5410_016986 [Solanum commersonii]|uniref:Uncharacterized protein n=1 Tax=Solanum commersonii TaxID=4109 RepID=A0A9J5ZYS6_SOLCO|nr:hypothetical protein H5410_016986 [Solanum commersonii]